MKITVAGTGYVGLSLGVLLAQNHEVKALDIIEEKVNMINKGISPIKEPILEQMLKNGCLNLKATTDKEFAYTGAELIIVATPTNYKEAAKYFDTSSIDDVVKNALKYCPQADIVVKSTVPVGFIESMRKKYNISNIYFSPEFLREGKSVYDNLHPSRIIVGDKGRVGKMFSNLLLECSLDENVPVILMDPTEAEAVKLFANTYLAMRVAYFNELDMYAEKVGLDSESIIKGISYDPRIGNYYNNPSFGYSGYCLPKDSKQLLANFELNNVPHDIVEAVVKSNISRADFIAERIREKKPETVGIYRLIMKADSDNFREAAIINIVNKLNCRIVIYEPTLNDKLYRNYEIVNNLEDFSKECDIILANRMTEELMQYKNKVYTRDLFREN